MVICRVQRFGVDSNPREMARLYSIMCWSKEIFAVLNCGYVSLHLEVPGSKVQALLTSDSTMVDRRTATGILGAVLMSTED